MVLVERGGAVVAALIVVTGLVGRTLKGELPTGFSTGTGSLTYTEAASSSDTIAAGLIERLDEQDAVLAGQEERLDELTQRTVAIAAEEEPQQPPEEPGRSARIRP